MSLSFALLCIFIVGTAIATAPVVRISNGVLSGVDLTQAEGFLGIPFAQPPVGKLRFAAPQPALPWSGVLDASKFGAGCPQDCSLPPHTCPEVQSEDCLSLNVYRPKGTTASSSLPVIFFIEGGGFTQGTAGVVVYDARYLSNATNVIVVTTNYRLGALGFLVNDKSLGSFGMLDQRLALKWVQQNIAAFGGNPNLVTLWGQSAGGSSVGFHLLASASWGLFHRAVMNSNPTTVPYVDHDVGILISKCLGKQIGCMYDDLDCFRNCTGACLAKLVQASNDCPGLNIFDPWHGILPFSPAYGPGEELSQSALELLLAGKTAPNVPVIMSACAQDGIAFSAEGFPDGIGFAEYIGIIGDLFGPVHVPEITTLYPSLVSRQQRALNFAQLATDYLFTCPSRLLTRTSLNHSSTFFFIFAHAWSFGEKGWGPKFQGCANASCHGAELPFEFGSGRILFDMTSDELTLQRDIQTAISNFAVTGDPNNGPNGRLQKKWPSATTGATYVFATPASSVDPDYRAQHCAFWNQFGYQRGEQMRKRLMKMRAITNERRHR